MISIRKRTPTRRPVMNKLLIAIAAAFFAVTTLFASAAEAGFNARIGGAPSQFSTLHKAGCGGTHRRRVHRKRLYQSRRLAAKRRAIAARKARARAIAKARAKARAKAKALASARAAAAKEAEVAEVADISTSDEVAETKSDEPEKVAAVSEELGCRKFVPEVGMTVTVPCE
jgi:hypothetical protein